MVHVSQAEVKGVLGRRDHLRLSKKDQMTYWHYDLHQYIEKNSSLQESIIVFGQKFVNMGLPTNFVLTTLMDFMWTSLIIMWQSVFNQEIPKLQKDTQTQILQRRCEELTLQLQSQRAAFVAEVVSIRTNARGNRFLNNYEQRVQELMPDDPTMFFDLNGSMSEPEAMFFSSAMRESIACALIQGADISKGELKESAKKIAGLEMKVEELRDERDSLEHTLTKQKTQMLTEARNAADSGNVEAKHAANMMLELMTCKEELVRSQSQAAGFRENVRRLELALQEGQTEFVKLQEATANHALDLKEANERIIATNLELTTLQQSHDNLAAKTDASTAAEAQREKLNCEKDAKVAALQEHNSRLEQELQVAMNAVADHAKMVAHAEQELAEKNQVIVHFETQIEQLEAKHEKASEQFAKKLADASKGMSSTQEGLQEQISAMDDEMRESRQRKEEKTALILQLTREKEQLEAQKQQIKEEVNEMKRQRDVMQSSVESKSLHEAKLKQMDERIVEQEKTLKEQAFELRVLAEETRSVSSYIGTKSWKDWVHTVASHSKEAVQRSILEHMQSQLDMQRTGSDATESARDVKKDSKVVPTRAPETTPAATHVEPETHAARGDLVDKSVVAAAEARFEQDREKHDKEVIAIRKELSAAKVENTRLTLALEELSTRFEEIKEMMAAKGVDVSLLDAALEQSGLADLVRGAAQGMKVFDRLYLDGMNRLHRRQENRQRLLLMQQEELHQVLHVLVTPRNTVESAQEVFDDFYRVLQKYPQGRAALHCGGVNTRAHARGVSRAERIHKKSSPGKVSPDARLPDVLCISSRVREESDAVLQDFSESLDRSRSPLMTVAAHKKRSDSRPSPHRKRKPQQRPMTQPTNMSYDHALHERWHASSRFPTCHSESLDFLHGRDSCRGTLESLGFLDAHRSVSPLDEPITRHFGSHVTRVARSPRSTGMSRAKETERKTSGSPTRPAPALGHGRSLELFLDQHVGPCITAYNRASLELPPKSLLPDSTVHLRLDSRSAIRHPSPPPIKTLERKPSLAGRPATIGGDPSANLIIAPIGFTKPSAQPQTTEPQRGRQRKNISPLRDITFLRPDTWLQDATLPADASTSTHAEHGERGSARRARDRVVDRSRAHANGERHLGRALTKAPGPTGDYMRHLVPLRIGPEVHSILGATSVPIIPSASALTIPPLRTAKRT